MEFKTYILKETGEFFTFDFDSETVDGWTSSTPYFYPMSHDKDSYFKHLREFYPDNKNDILDKIELITLKVEKYGI